MKMVLDMKGSGIIRLRMEKENSGWSVEIFLKVNLLMDNSVKDLISKLMGVHILENSRMVYIMVMVN